MEEQNVPKKSILQMWWAWVLIIFFVLIVWGVISGAGKTTETASQTSTTPTTTQPVSTATPTLAPQFVFDIPALVGKNADDVSIALKDYQKKTPPPTQQQIAMGVKDWDMEFEKDGKDLLASYVIATKKVNNFFISTDDPSGATKDKKHLLELGNLSESDPRYKVEFVKTLKDSARFTGVKVTPR